MFKIILFSRDIFYNGGDGADYHAIQFCEEQTIAARSCCLVKISLAKLSDTLKFKVFEFL